MNEKDCKRDRLALNQRGFTLVELIVVMVILTILAAILIPGLLGWIDEAKGKQYVLNARSLYMSAQAIESEKYAAWDGTTATASHNLNESDTERIRKMADVDATAITDLEFESENITAEGAASNHGYYTITGITVEFEGVTVVLKDGVWTVYQ